MCLCTCVHACVISTVCGACLCVCASPPRSRCTVGNEGIRSREQITLPEDNEIISHLQLLDEERKQCRCVCEREYVYQLNIVITPKH